MAAVRHPARWQWSDHPAPGRVPGRWWLFIRAGEAVTTGIVASYAAVFALPGSTLATVRSYAWLARLSGGSETPWAAWALALLLVAPLAVALDAGALRFLSVLSQCLFFALIADSFYVGNPLGFGWAANAILAGWLGWRAATLLRHHARRG